MKWRATIGISALLAFSSCYAPPQCRQVIAVEPHHDTRVYVTYEDDRGNRRKSSVHASNRFACGDTVVNPRDYLGPRGTLQYGPLAQYNPCGTVRPGDHGTTLR